jgi:hypothetical protein
VIGGRQAMAIVGNSPLLREVCWLGILRISARPGPRVVSKVERICLGPPGYFMPIMNFENYSNRVAED